MLGYVFLSLALLAGVTKGYCGKRTSGYVCRYRDASLANLVRMALCIAIGGVAAATRAANLRNTALVFYFTACLFGLDSVAEKLAVVGIASFHRIVGHSSIDEIIT